MWVDFDVRDNRTFSLEETFQWIMDLYFIQKQQFEIKNKNVLKIN